MTIVGLRLRAHSRERARRQWETVLEGHPSEGPEGELIYGWPDSPMRLAVEIDPARDEGPVAIELASDRADRAARWSAPGAGHRLQARQDFSRVKVMKMWPEPAGATNAVGRAFAVSGALSQVLSDTPSRT